MNNNLRDTLLGINAQWDHAFNQGQAQSLAALYDEAATVIPSGATQVSGRNNIQAFWQSLLAQGVADHHIEMLEVGSDGGLAFQRGQWSATAPDAQGHRQNYSGNLHLLYRQQADGSWKALTHIWN